VLELALIKVSFIKRCSYPKNKRVIFMESAKARLLLVHQIAGGDFMEEDYLKDELLALKLAIEFEKKIRTFYLGHAEKLKRELAKKTFVFLADEELKHIEAIKAFNKSIHDGEEPMIDSGTEDEAINRAKEFFAKSMEEQAEKTRASASELKVYELGLEMEQNGYNFYKENSEKAEHPNVKKLFDFLVKEENGHYALLSNAINYFKHPAEYFQDKESWFFEG
jgi:rubrerythrin